MTTTQQFLDNLADRLRAHFERIRDERPSNDSKHFLGGYIQAGYDLGLITVKERDAVVESMHQQVFGMSVSERRTNNALSGSEKYWDVFDEPAYKRYQKHLLPKVFYITGRGGNHNEGLGGYIETLEVVYDGLSITEDYLRKSFEDQINHIGEHLDKVNPTHVIANSYGAYLLMHYLMSFEAKPYRVLLLSPILGKGISTNRIVRPPNSKQLKACIESGCFPKPKHLEIHIGEHDMPELALWANKHIKADKCNVISNQGHRIEEPLVRRIIDEFL